MQKRWEVVGGTDKGGILVREGRDLKSAALPERLSTGAIVEELNLLGDRLNYRLEIGGGPATGWVSLKAAGGALLEPKKFDPYALLGIPPDATNKAIKSGYRKSSLACHPDRNPDPDAAAKFRELTRARDFLLNPLKRLLYNVKNGLQSKQELVKWWSTWDELFEELERADEESVPAVAPALREDRPIDVLVFGATGLVGMLACAQISDRLGPGRTWAVAGRDERKLGLVKDKFGVGPAFRGVIQIAKEEEIESAARTARVLLDFSGPKILMGDVVAEACARAGTHAIDCSGWRGDVVQKALTKEGLDRKAQAAGIALVCFCGWSATPHDFGVWSIVRHVRAAFGTATRSVDSYEINPGICPGGAVQQSFAGDGKLLENEKRLGEFMLGGERKGGAREEDCLTKVAPFLHNDFGVWINPVVLPDRVVVRCSCGLLDSHPDQAYGDSFSYRNWNFCEEKLHADMSMMHAAAMPRRPYSKFVAEGKMPPVGCGPGERLREEATVARVFEAVADEPTPQPRRAHLIQRLGPGGPGDPHAGSALAGVEAACCLLDALDGGGEVRRGLGTPVYHLGHLGYCERVVARGWQFALHDGPAPPDLFKTLLGKASQAIAD